MMAIFGYLILIGKKKHNPRFFITFALKNEPLAKKILEIIEYGHIRYKPKEIACVLIVFLSNNKRIKKNYLTNKR